jgi:hypothetical protein
MDWMQRTCGLIKWREGQVLLGEPGYGRECFIEVNIDNKSKLLLDI